VICSGSINVTCTNSFAQHFSCQVMEVLMTLQGSQMESDDPITSYMLQVCQDLMLYSYFMLALLCVLIYLM
jgi:hypothetical protein